MAFLGGNGVLVRGHQNRHRTEQFHHREQPQCHDDRPHRRCAIRPADGTDACFQCNWLDHLHGCRGEIDGFAAGIGVADLFAAAEKRLGVALSAVQNDVLTGVRRSGQQHRTAARPFICHQLHPKRIRQINGVKAAVERYRLDVHTDVRHPHAPALYHCDVGRKFSAVH